MRTVATQARALAIPILGILAGACATAPRRLIYETIPSRAVHAKETYAVYLPPRFDSAEQLPLVVFLHGGGDGADCFDEAGVGPILDAAIAAGTMPRVVILVPDGDLGFWENWYDRSAHWRDMVMHELLPRVRDQYRTAPCPAGCHVMGISMGGHGALRFAQLEHRSFASATIISGAILDTDKMIEFSQSFLVKLFVPVERIWGPTDHRARIAEQDIFLRWRGPADLKGVRLQLAWGDADRGGIAEANQRFAAHLDAHHIPYRKLIFPGGHKWTSWAPVLPELIARAVAPRPRASPLAASPRVSQKLEVEEGRVDRPAGHEQPKSAS